MDEEVVIILFTVLVLVSGGIVLLLIAVKSRRHLRELEHRERLAMIERGLMPSPETDPAAFDAVTAAPRVAGGGERYRSAGVAMIGFGFALMMLIGVAAETPAVGLGVGGAWVLLGAALVANFYLVRRDRMSDPPPARWTPPARHRDPEPPTNVAP